MRWLLALLVFVIVLVAIPTAAPAPECLFSVGQHVKLYSPEYDPKVLIWNSKSTLVKYLRKDWQFSEAYDNTNIAEANTNAIVEAACPSGVETVLEIKILDGRHKGLHGWVNIIDARNK